MMKKIICNSCGKEIKMENGIVQEDYLSIRKEWGYFSRKDGEIHQLILCENCYDNITEMFQRPVLATEITEYV